MALILPVNNVMPRFGAHCFLADNATVVGDVTCGDYSSVWFQAVVRGDVNSIQMGDYVNVQDGAVVHCTFERAATTIGSYVSIGHRAVVHGCTVEDYVLVGMGAIVMDHAVVQREVIVAAGAVVLENAVLESGYLYAGVPAKRVKPLTDAQRETLRRTAHNYVRYASWF